MEWGSLFDLQEGFETLYFLSRILKQSEAGAKTSEICRQHGISTATFTDGAVSTGDWK